MEAGGGVVQQVGRGRMICVKCKAETPGTPNPSGIVVPLCATCRETIPKRGRHAFPRPACHCGRPKERSSEECRGCYQAGKRPLDPRLRDLAWAMGKGEEHRHGPPFGWEIEFLADMEKFLAQWNTAKARIEYATRPQDGKETP